MLNKLITKLNNYPTKFIPNIVVRITLSLFGIFKNIFVQGQLADYNLLVDKLNTDTDRADVEMECRDLKLENDQLSQEV